MYGFYYLADFLRFEGTTVERISSRLYCDYFDNGANINIFYKFDQSERWVDISAAISNSIIILIIALKLACYIS